jgi:hypothetical protein
MIERIVPAFHTIFVITIAAFVGITAVLIIVQMTRGYLGARR